MTRYWRTACAAALLSLVALPAAAQQPTNNNGLTATAAARQHWYKQTAATLSKRPDADSLVTAAVLQDNSQDKLHLLDRAAKADPGAAGIAALAQMTCSFIKGCDAVSRGQHLLTIDPDNALAWMPELHAARMTTDAAKATDLLQRMAQSKKFDTYHFSIGARVRQTLLRAPGHAGPDLKILAPHMQSSAEANLIAVRYTHIPAYQTLVRACDTSRSQFPQRRASCRNIGLLLEQSGTRIGNHIGLALHRHCAANAPDYAQALASGRRLDWQLHAYETLRGNIPEAGMVAYAKATLAHHGEMAGIQALLAKAGVSLDPPVNWIDKTQASSIALEKWRAQALATLTKTHEADSLVTAAVVQRDLTSRLQLLDRASRADSGASDIAALALLTCTFSEGCDDLPRGEHLRAVDPDNALAWMPKLRTARTQSNTTEVTRILQRMAHSRNFETYHLRVTARLEHGLFNLPVYPGDKVHGLSDNDARSISAAYLVLFSVHTPAYDNVLRACASSRAQFKLRRASCRRIGLLLEHSSTLYDESVGLTLHRRAATDAADYRQALATERRQDWQIQQDVSHPNSHRAAKLVAFTQTAMACGSSICAIQAALKKAGIALDPPSKWVDETEAWQIAQDKKTAQTPTFDQTSGMN